MEIKIIGSVDYKEPEALIKKNRSFIQSEYRWIKPFFLDRRYFEIRNSPNKKYSLSCRYKNNIRWGNPYYNLFLELINEDRKKIIKDFGHRIFEVSYIANSWSNDSNKFCVIERHTIKEGKDDKSVILYDLINDEEKSLIRENKDLYFLGWSGANRYILYKAWSYKYFEVFLFDIAETKIKFVRKGQSLQDCFAFFFNEDKYLLLLDQSESPRFNIFDLPNVNLIYSIEMRPDIFENIMRILPTLKEIPFSESLPGTNYRSDRGEKRGLYWDEAFLKDNYLYLGILRVFSWHDGDYYKCMEWLKCKLIY